MTFKTIEWTENGVVMIDQRALPAREAYLTLKTPEEIADAIKKMAIRGAPAIGVAAAMGIALGAKNFTSLPPDEFKSKVEALFPLFASTRPTAVNLFWAIKRMKNLFEEKIASSPDRIAALMVLEAHAIMEEDIHANRRIGEFGSTLIPSEASVLTHCNAGALATAGHGTALGVIRTAVGKGKKVRVFADETRPFLQGARLTAWELIKDGIPVTLITDNMAGYMMNLGEIDLVIVGADRVAANGDLANKIGTYSLSILAKEHGIPFYVAAPVSTIDMSIDSGKGIPIEERNREEITHFHSIPVAPERVHVRNPAFDVTPHANVTAIITERGIARPPYRLALNEITGSRS
ncbi:MAG: S-methyl-5-thioribose-1-phosphate isomerase [Acidobacteriota bacterium]